jgi:hypothetical protein
MRRPTVRLTIGTEAPRSEGKGHTFESCRVRHFGTELGTAKPAVFALHRNGTDKPVN